MQLRQTIKSFRTKIGDFWWYSLLMMIALRLGDLINAFVGLYLVPSYVDMTELGALMPLANVGILISMPLGVVITVFTKYLNTYAVHNEMGKVKAIIRDAFILGVVGVLASAAVSIFILPPVFERLRIENGLLGATIVFSGVITVIAPVFSNALQALKKFNFLTFSSLFGTVVRLGSMLVLLPIRGVTGYFASQSTPSIATIFLSVWALRKTLFSSIRCEPYLKKDMKEMFMYGLPIFFASIIGASSGTIMTFIIRHRLTDEASAAFYMLSRFTDIVAYVGCTLVIILFPTISEAHERGNDSKIKFLLQSVIATLGFGFLLTICLRVFGTFIFDILTFTRPYVKYVPEMLLLGFSTTLNIAFALVANYETACRKFTYLWYSIPLSFFPAAFLYLWFGIEFFNGILPVSIVNFFKSFDIANLSFVIGYSFIFSLIQMSCAIIHFAVRQNRLKRISAD